MKRLRWLGFGIALTLILSGYTVSGWAQEKTVSEDPVGTEPEMQWLWGEVVSVDAAKNEIRVKYLDYEADVEKEIALSADDKTTFENVKSLAEIKPQDTVSVDYIVGVQGRNLAKNFSVEKAEIQEPVSVPATEPQASDTNKLMLQEKNPLEPEGAAPEAQEKPAQEPAAAAPVQ